MPNDLRLGGATSEARWVADCNSTDTSQQAAPTVVLHPRDTLHPPESSVLPAARIPHQALPAQQRCRLPVHAVTANAAYRQAFATPRQGVHVSCLLALKAQTAADSV